MEIEPKPAVPMPSTSEAVMMVMVVSCARARHIREARAEGEWQVRGLELPSGRGVKSTPTPT